MLEEEQKSPENFGLWVESVTIDIDIDDYSIAEELQAYMKCLEKYILLRGC